MGFSRFPCNYIGFTTLQSMANRSSFLRGPPGLYKSQMRMMKDHKYFDPKNIRSSEDLELPVKFSSTGGHKIQPILYPGGKRDVPEYQGKVVALSLGVFMIYFFVLREENDIDLAMKGEGKQADEIDEIIKNQLLETKKIMSSKGLDTFDIELRLREMDARKKERNVKSGLST